MSPFSIICIRTFTFDFKYLPFGGTRQLPNQPTSGLTDYGYTGQRNLDEDIGLMDYKARFYSPVLNRFIQPDSIVPNPANPQAWNRFSYVVNSPINFNDPSGHVPIDCIGSNYCGSAKDPKYVLNSQIKPKKKTFDEVIDKSPQPPEFPIKSEDTSGLFVREPDSENPERGNIGCVGVGAGEDTYCSKNMTFILSSPENILDFNVYMLSLDDWSLANPLQDIAEYGLLNFLVAKSEHAGKLLGPAGLAYGIYNDYKISTVDLMGDNVSNTIVGGNGSPVHVEVKTYIQSNSLIESQPYIYVTSGEYSSFTYSGNLSATIFDYFTR